MSSSSSSPNHQLPESLRVQLGRFRAHLWRIKVIEAVAAGFMGLLVSYLLVYGLDRIVPTPAWARLLILLGGVSLFAGFAPYWWHKWVWKQRREEQLARLIARKFPGMGDRLLGVIELEHQEGNPDTLSPRLREAAMIAVAVEIRDRKLDEAIPAPRHVKWALAAMGMAVVATSVLIFTPRAGINALQRWLMPLSDTQRYTFTRLDSPPTRLTVPFGESFEVRLQLAKDTEQRPERGFGRIGAQTVVPAELANGGYTFRFSGQQDPTTILFRIGDLQHACELQPVLRPAIEKVVAMVAMPEYLKRDPATVDLNNGLLPVVAGGSFEVTLTTTRPLSRGTYGPATIRDEKGMTVPLEDLPGGDLVIDESTAKTPRITPQQSFSMPFDWTDRIGLTGDGGFQLQVEVRPDGAPACYMQGVDRQIAILPQETIDFEILAEDDLGVEHVGLVWSGEHLRPTDQAPASGELRLGGKGNDTRLLSPVAFSPQAFGIAPQKLTLRGYVEDALPGRGRIYSEEVTVYVLTLDEHAQMLKSRFDRQISELEDLMRREIELLDENERLERLDGKELQNEENQHRVQQQEIEEMETARRSEELKNQMEKLLQDAARNPDIDKDVLKKMAEALKSMQELAEQDVPQLQENLRQAQDPANAPEQAGEEMDKAVETQRRMLEKMQEALDKAGEANRNMEAGTFVNRLKKAAQEEEAIVAALTKDFSDDQMLGKHPKQLDPAVIRRLDASMNQQSTTGSDVRWIQEDLISYHARTQQEKFAELLKKMSESNIEITMENVRQMMAKNHSFHAALKAREAAAQLKEWAKMLEEQNQSGGGGGGGGGGQQSQEEDFEFMLRVMRMVQQEMDLRGRTRALEQLRRDQAHQP